MANRYEGIVYRKWAVDKIVISGGPICWLVNKFVHNIIFKIRKGMAVMSAIERAIPMEVIFK